MNLVERKILCRLSCKLISNQNQSKLNNNKSNDNIRFIPKITGNCANLTHCLYSSNINNSNNVKSSSQSPTIPIRTLQSHATHPQQKPASSAIVSKLRAASSIAISEAAIAAAAPQIEQQSLDEIRLEDNGDSSSTASSAQIGVCARSQKQRQQKNILNIANDNEVAAFENIPAAKGLPIFGTHLDFLAAGSAQQLHKYIHSRHMKLGPIFRERLGGTQDAVFVASPGLMRTVFNYEGQYPMHPLPESWNLYNKKHNCRRGLFFMNGPEWLQNRRIMNKFLLNGNCNWINQHIHNSTANVIEIWKKKCRSKNSSFELSNLEAELYRWSIDVLTSIMFGRPIAESGSNELLDEIEIFAKNVHKIFDSSSALMSFPPRLAEILKLRVWTEFETTVTDVLEMGNRVIDKCVMEFGYGNGLMAKMVKVGMCMDDIRRIFVDLIIAAGDTTAHSTQWALYLLSKSENVQQSARKELSSFDRSEDSQYIKGLIKETLRLYPVAPFIGRFLASDANIGNYHIEKNTLVLLSLFTSGRDENSFPDASKVLPERWFRNSNGELQNVQQPTATIPFAMGIRSCIGKKIALSQMQALLSQIVSNFELSCLNEGNIDVILRMVAVPNQPIRLSIKQL